MNHIPEARAFELRVIPSRTQLFTFGAITWNRHKIHFDRAHAEAEGFSDVVVQRGLLGNFLARSVARWAGAAGHLERLQWKVQQSAFPDQELRCLGEVTKVLEGGAGSIVECALQILDARGGQVAVGEARVRFPCS
jgi:hydroxyacyl-ACP dehydratase HTD2-like protein with hotdog domain